MHTEGNQATTGVASHMIQVVAVLLLFVLFAGAASAQAFNFGISPGSADEGVHEPGSSFFTSFVLVTNQEDPIDIELDYRDAGIRSIGDSQKANFSEQSCGECIEFLRGDGAMEDGAADAEQWKNVEFFVNIPEDAEPGYHRLEVTPQPSTSSGGGGVGLVSSVSFPVTFQVSGDAIRSGQILGVHAGRNVAGEQEVVTTYYNDGTVTTRVSAEIMIETEHGNETVRAGSDMVPPGEEARFTARIDTLDLVNGSVTPDEVVDEEFTVHATADYTTGEAMHTATLTPSEPISIQAAAVRDEVTDPGIISYLALLVLLVLSTLVTWKVVMKRAWP